MIASGKRSPRTLVFRFSSLGDLILLAPVLYAAARYNPQEEFILVTRERFSGFMRLIPGVKVHLVSEDKLKEGIRSLYQLASELDREYKPTRILDCHQNLRTLFFKSFFRAIGVSVFTFKKGRATKRRALPRLRRNRSLNPALPHAIERYREVFVRAGFLCPVVKGEAVFSVNSEASTFWKGSRRRLGIAPFSSHAVKAWSFDRFSPLLQRLASEYSDLDFYLYGGGGIEREKLRLLAAKLPEGRALVIADVIAAIPSRFTREELEVASVQGLVGMVSMDSANLHLAQNQGIKTATFFGPTHPAVGFGPYDPANSVILEISPEELPCRPCSVFGDLPCHRGDQACLVSISTERVMDVLRKDFLA